MLLDQFALLREIEPERKLSPDELFAAIQHLEKALETLDELRKVMGEGVFDESFPEKLEQSWNEVNKCRVYTEKILFMEELLVPVLGEIYIAKSMFESLVAWKLGMTQAGYNSIMGSIFNALGGIRPCLEELSSWQERSEGEDTESGSVPTE